MSEIQLALNLTEEICELHKSVAKAIGECVEIAIAIGEKLYLADDAPGFDFAKLPFDSHQCQRYRNAFDRREEIRQMDFLQLLSVPAVRAQIESARGPVMQWAKWAKPIGTFFQWVRKREAEMPVEQWPPIHRYALRDRLKPIVELYERLSK